MKFKKGDRVYLAKTHLYQGVEYTSEALPGATGVVNENYEHYEHPVEYVHVKWNENEYCLNQPHSSSNADVSCLALELGPPTAEELAEVFASILGTQEES